MFSANNLSCLTSLSSFFLYQSWFGEWETFSLMFSRTFFCFVLTLYAIGAATEFGQIHIGHYFKQSDLSKIE